MKDNGRNTAIISKMIFVFISVLILKFGHKVKVWLVIQGILEPSKIFQNGNFQEDNRL